MKITTALSFFALLALPLQVIADIRTKPVIAIPQSTNVKGTWNCYVTPSAGGSSNETYTFSQTGNKFVSSGDATSYKIYGTIEGSAINISRVVNGEFLEGYVMHAEGHIISINGRSNNGIVTVYHTSQAGTGSFNCYKPPA